MTAGLPGTGIGGLFYLLSALVMPLRQAYLALRGRPRPGGWGTILVQTAIAGGILAGMWVAGWLLGLLLAPAVPVAAGAGAPAAPNVLRTGMLVIAVATLAVVLLAVEVLRLVIGVCERRAAAQPEAADPAPVPDQPPLRQRRRFRRRVALMLAFAVCHGWPLAGQYEGVIASRLVQAESAYAAGDAARAEAEYYAVLGAEPANSRATYRLAELRQNRDPEAALALYRRYVELEPQDPWGYVAVGATLSRLGRHGAALKWYEAGARLAPNERDVAIGRARVLARLRRVSAALDAYESWLRQHPGDAEAAREIIPLRTRAAPIATPFFGATGDSEGNRAFRIGASFESPLIKEARFGLVVGQEQVGDGVRSTALYQIGARADFRAAAFTADATVGAVFFGLERGSAPTPNPGGPAGPSGPSGPSGPDTSHGPPAAPPGRPSPMLLDFGERAVPTIQARARWRPAGGPSVDLRAQHGPLMATSHVLASRVTRSEVRATAELPLSPVLRLRGMGRAAALDDSSGTNYRTSVGSGVAFAVMPAGDVSINAHQIRFARPSSAGYFAPRFAQIIEAASYVEFEAGSSLLVAFDAGLGVQRSAEFGAAAGPWGRAMRLYSLVSLKLAPARDLRFELEAEDSPLANEAATGAGWRYVAGTVSVRWGF